MKHTFLFLLADLILVLCVAQSHAQMSQMTFGAGGNGFYATPANYGPPENRSRTTYGTSGRYYYYKRQAIPATTPQSVPASPSTVPQYNAQPGSVQPRR